MMVFVFVSPGRLLGVRLKEALITLGGMRRGFTVRSGKEELDPAGRENRKDGHRGPY